MGLVNLCLTLPYSPSLDVISSVTGSWFTQDAAPVVFQPHWCDCQLEVWRVWFILCPLAVPNVMKSPFPEQFTSKRRCLLGVPRLAVLSPACPLLYCRAVCSQWPQDAPTDLTFVWEERPDWGEQWAHWEMGFLKLLMESVTSGSRTAA